jgi:hypothetical protein
MSGIRTGRNFHIKRLHYAVLIVINKDPFHFDGDCLTKGQVNVGPLFFHSM